MAEKDQQAYEFLIFQFIKLYVKGILISQGGENQSLYVLNVSQDKCGAALRYSL